ncbi:MAG: hypothetical protein FJ020_02605 [Chloroflexi bacterium]|nr:hypothetical protein [Chloroflexota bacterium]
MTQRIVIRAAGIEVRAELNQTRTAAAVRGMLPIEGKANRWGDEIYFPIPLQADIEGGREVVDMGDLGYWPEGSCLCIFFGPTPASRKNEIRAASAVTIIGRVTDDPKVLKRVAQGATVRIDAVQSGDGPG